MSNPVGDQPNVVACPLVQGGGMSPDFLNLLDSQNVTLDIEYAYFRALAEYESRLADMEAAIGTALPGERRKSWRVFRDELIDDGPGCRLSRAL